MVNPVCFLGFNLGEYSHLRVSRGPSDIDVYANKKFEPGSRSSPRRPSCSARAGLRSEAQEERIYP